MHLPRRSFPLLAATMSLALLPVPPAAGGKSADQPARVVVQHILVAFKRSLPDRNVTRGKDEARALAEELLARARAGEDFDALVRAHSDDAHPGIYLLTDRGAPLVAGGRGRDEMVPRFGDVAFALGVGEVGLAAYHAALSPYGWHVIKRLE